MGLPYRAAIVRAIESKNYFDAPKLCRNPEVFR